MARRTLLMKGDKYKPEKHKIGGWFMSEKIDGGRIFWDGGLTRGMRTVEVPWAGIINPKTGQPKAKIKPVSTGLWSPNGNPIIAPDWFLNSLPCCPLDGEMWLGRGKFQKTMSCLRKDTPVNSEWKEIRYGVFGTPNFQAFLADGEIKNPQQHTNLKNTEEWFDDLELEDWFCLRGEPAFETEVMHLCEWIDETSDTVYVIPQTKLPDDHDEAARIVYEKKASIISEGGEGLFLRCPESIWTPKKMSKTSLKAKGQHDDEGIVTGFTCGRETDLGSKLLGRIGSLVLDYKGQRLELAGLTDEEREFATEADRHYANEHPGEDMPEGTQGKHFKVGDQVTFTYFELSDDGIPKLARYLRQRKPE